MAHSPLPSRGESLFAHIQNVARDAGIKLTHQRLEIFRELAKSSDHPDAETIFKAVQRRVPTVSLDTVYRTLWKLRDLGLVKTLGPSGEAVRFDVNIERHHHYVCVRCGLVRDFDSEELNGLPIPSGVKHFGSVLEAQVEVRGLCAPCHKAKRTSSKKKSAIRHEGEKI
jgi:Fur family peroxide stress response transcriptional regulator